uniref:Uncharacterized protein n=1 Tax=Quercus lobata TaxID=97700 RepID=A0A7N2LVG5_QUELO
MAGIFSGTKQEGRAYRIAGRYGIFRPYRPVRYIPIVPAGAIGTDCSTLKISSSNKSTSATPAFSDDAKSATGTGKWFPLNRWRKDQA